MIKKYRLTNTSKKKTMEQHVIFPISTLLIGKKGKIFPFSQKANPKVIKNYHFATMSKKFPISHSLSGEIYKNHQLVSHYSVKQLLLL
jgi:hypothetical protein